MRAALLVAAFVCLLRAGPPPLAIAAEPAAQIYRDTNSAALVLVVVRGSDVYFQGFGEKASANSLVRLCSVTKIFAADLFARLVQDKTVHLNDPLQRFAPAHARVPTRTRRGQTTRAITLEDLATHTSGLPREVLPYPAHSGHFAFPNSAQRWAWLPKQKLLAAPGATALYSNVAFDLLADALSTAAHEPYPRLLAERTTTPLGMRDTTFSPTPQQCAQLLRGSHDEGACNDTTATAGSAGLYSTPADMARWLVYLVNQQPPAAQAVYVQLATLRSVVGLNHAGTPSGIGLGWLQLGERGDPSMILEKTGGGAGFNAYLAINPAQHTGLFLGMVWGGGPWHNPFEPANNILLALSNLPPLPVEPHRAPAKKHVKRVHRRKIVR